MDYPFAVLILSAGLGKRMNTQFPKVLQRICDKPLLYYVLQTSISLNPERIIIVVGYKGELVREEFREVNEVEFVTQHELLGTGHAVMQTEALLGGFEGKLLILYGDTPLLRAQTLKPVLDKAIDCPFVVLSFKPADPAGYGRIIRDGDGHLVRIIEERDANDDEKAIREVNSGVYLVDKDLLFSLLKQVGNKNSQGEYYLTDTVSIYMSQGGHPEAVLTPFPDDFHGVNTIEQLKLVEGIMKKRLMQ